MTFYYPNIVSPPGEFSAIRTDALHLIRVLLHLRNLKVMILSNYEILSLAHTIKYGIPIGYSQLGAIPKIGHIRGNLLRITAQKLNLEMPRFGMPVGEFFDSFQRSLYRQRHIKYFRSPPLFSQGSFNEKRGVD